TGLSYVFSKERKFIRRMAMGDVDFFKIRQDGMVFVVKNSRNIMEIRTLDGHAIRQFNNFKKIVDVAFDPLDNIYLLTNKGRGLSVLTSDFRIFQSVQLQSITHSSSRYNHLTVDQGSNIFLSVSREREILKVY
ncbi:MAG: hypothetical protein GXO70_04925, partial [Acidobacteria bacterium]|nr:hypothetical protein [Acidobacteriota bacterium]